MPAFDDQVFLFDLAPDGDPQLVVTGIGCERPGGERTFGVAVFAPAGSAGWQGLSVLPHPDGGQDARWAEDGDGRLAVHWEGRDDPVTYRWTGSELTPAE